MIRHCSQRPARKLALAGICLSTLLAGIGLPNGASAGSLDRGFIATAEASGMYLRYGIPGFLVVENFIDGGGPVSQALLGSDGTSQSFASLPYPGPTAIGYPGLAALVLGSAPPGYPFYASASNPVQPEQTVSDPSGSYSLDALADDSASSGDARFAPGGDPEQAASATQARSDVVVEGEKVSATAVSLARGVVAGPLTLGTVRSTSVTTYEKGADKPVTKTELSVEGGKVGDMSFSFGREGLQVAQQGVPIPAASGLQALNQALEPAALSIHFAESRPLEGGAVAGALEIVNSAPVPGAGTGTFRVRFGGSMSFISLGAREGDPFEEETPSTSASDSSTSPSDAPAPDTEPFPSSTGALPASPTSDATGTFIAPAPAAVFESGFGFAGSTGAGPVGGVGVGFDDATGEQAVAETVGALSSTPAPAAGTHRAQPAAATAQLFSLDSTSYISALLGLAALLAGGVALWSVVIRKRSQWTA